MKIGDRARFTGVERVYSEGQRTGKLGTIKLDANLDEGSNFGGGTCFWQVDGEEGLYETALSDLTLEELVEVRELREIFSSTKQ